MRTFVIKYAHNVTKANSNFRWDRESLHGSSNDNSIIINTAL